MREELNFLFIPYICYNLYKVKNDYENTIVEVVLYMYLMNSKF